MQVLLEVEFEHTNRISDILNRRRDRYERQNDIALANVVLDPLPIDGDITLHILEAGTIHKMADVGGPQIHAVDLVVIGKQLLGEMTADETIDAENEYRSLPGGGDRG